MRARRESVVRREFERFREGMRRMEEIRESNMRRISEVRGHVAFAPAIATRERSVRVRKRREEEFEFMKMLKEGVASKFLKITPIATPEKMLKGVMMWRR